MDHLADGTGYKDLVKLMRDRLLSINVSERDKTENVYLEMSKILDKCLDEDYLTPITLEYSFGDSNK